MLDQAFDQDEYERRRHPVRRFLGWTLLLLVAALAGAAVFLLRYQPLTQGDTHGVRGDRVDQTDPAGARGASVVAYSSGASFDVVFSVANDGPVTVRITDLPDIGLRAVVSSYEVRVMPSGATAYDEGLSREFRPFRLRPGESRTLDLRYTFKDCRAVTDGGNRIVRTQQVGYDLVQRLPRVSDVRLAQPLVITDMALC